MLKENLVTDMMKTIADSYNDSYTKMFPMGAIYIYDIKQQVYKGDMVRVENNSITSKSHVLFATHEITGLFGTLAGNKLQIEVRNLSNNETKIIEL